VRLGVATRVGDRESVPPALPTAKIALVTPEAPMTETAE
jgi:hypothetical protein